MKHHGLAESLNVQTKPACRMTPLRAIYIAVIAILVIGGLFEAGAAMFTRGP